MNWNRLPPRLQDSWTHMYIRLRRTTGYWGAFPSIPLRCGKAPPSEALHPVIWARLQAAMLSFLSVTWDELISMQPRPAALVYHRLSGSFSTWEKNIKFHPWSLEVFFILASVVWFSVEIFATRVFGRNMWKSSAPSPNPRYPRIVWTSTMGEGQSWTLKKDEKGVLVFDFLDLLGRFAKDGRSQGFKILKYSKYCY